MTRKTTTALAAAAAACALLAAGCGSGFEDNTASTPQSSGPAKLQIMIGSSGEAETKAVQEAAEKWAQATGNSATVVPAQDMAQQLGQAFAGDSPPDVFYVEAGRFADYASVGALEPYASKISDPEGFYDSLRATFTYNGTYYCVPKDFSTLGLVINDELWKKAGLSESDVPTTWEELTSVSKKLKDAGITPLVIGDTRDRLGAFMKQAGGWIISQDGKQATADSQENLLALQYVQGLLKDGLAVYPSAVDAGWGRGVRQGQGRHDDRGQLDQGRHEGRLPGREVQRARAAGRARGQGHAVLHPVLGHRRQEQVQGAGDQLRRGDDHGRPADGLRPGVRRHAVPQGGR